jgi:hypothetical protein
MVVCVFSVGRRPATLETYQPASSRPTRGPEEDFHSFTGFMSKSSVVENFAKILNPKTHTPKISRHFRPEPRKFLENFESPYKICDKVDFQSVGRRPGGPETQTNISKTAALSVFLLPYALICLFSAICCLPFAVCCLPFAVCF